VINSVQEGLVREMNMQAIYDLVGNRICELFDTQTVLIRTFDHRLGEEQWQYVIEKGQRLYSNPRPFNWANQQLIKNKQPLLINENYIETAQKFGGTGVSKGLPPKSALFVPMVVGDIVRGSVSLQNVEKENAFTESDLRLLTTLTNSMSVALENARLFDESNRLLSEAKQRATELSTVNSISKALASQLNADDLIKMVGDQLKDLFRANIVYLALLNPKTRTINFPYQYGDNMAPLKLGEGLTSKIILNGEPLLINKDLQELRLQMGIQQIGVPAASYLGVPIPVGEENIGVLSVQSTEHENRFNENDLRLLSTIASSVGVALNNASLFEDVKLAKMEAEASGKAAEKANEAKSAFLSTVSHELRTPLTSVLGFAKIIRKRLEEKIFPIVDKKDPKTEKTIGQISENLHVVISEGERLTHLINDVLDLAKIEAGKMEWNQESVSMSEVAERAIAATSSLFDQKALKLIKNIETDLPEITGDRDKLIQVIINLISNSVKFTDKGSVTCAVSQKNNEILVSISDTGIGIAPEDFGAVFEQFKQVGGDTLTDKPKGTGLGLPICKEIVEHHGGRIWLESEVGKGSTFSFALPVTKTNGVTRPMHLDDLVRQLKEQVAQSHINLIGKASKILIVDDDDSIRSLLQQELGDAGYSIEEARNGKEALAAVRKQRPDLIILDIMMPEMNGFDVAAVLKNDPQTMDIPIIVLSIVQDKTRGFRIGVDRYLTKPIDTGLLFSEIGSLLEQGKSKKKVMVVDQDSATVNTLTEVLKTKGYSVMEANEKELLEKAIANQPDIIIINSLLSGKQDIVQTIRFEKGLENVLFLVYQ
jgi:signal transduction histidine kinase/DNA-binding response OmpR family regulator